MPSSEAAVNIPAKLIIIEHLGGGSFCAPKNKSRVDSWREKRKVCAPLRPTSCYEKLEFKCNQEISTQAIILINNEQQTFASRIKMRRRLTRSA